MEPNIVRIINPLTVYFEHYNIEQVIMNGDSKRNDQLIKLVICRNNQIMNTCNEQKSFLLIYVEIRVLVRLMFTVKM